MRKFLPLQTFIPFAAVGVLIRACRGDRSRSFIGFYPSSLNCTFAITLFPPPQLVAGTFAGAFVNQGPSSSPGWELNYAQHGELVWQEWWAFLAAGSPGGQALSVLELLQWEDSSDDRPAEFDEQAPAVLPAVPGILTESRTDYIGRILSEAKKALANAGHENGSSYAAPGF